MVMKSLLQLAMAAALVAVTAGSVASQALAETKFQKNHPRREQVSGRLANQNHRINQEVREGELTPQQGRKLHRQDRQIRQEERTMASQNGIHLTKSEQRVLNQQENAVSRYMGQ